MNKKGFTLVELLAVIAIISIISLIAVPNIINVIDNIKKDNMVSDANKLISLAKMEVNSSYEIRISGYHKFSITALNKEGDITNDPDGEKYFDDSYVEFSSVGSTYNYCIYLNGSKRKIGNNGSCVNEDQLNSTVVKSK